MHDRTPTQRVHRKKVKINTEHRTKMLMNEVTNKKIFAVHNTMYRHVN
jgi:hypothetical protein